MKSHFVVRGVLYLFVVMELAWAKPLRAQTLGGATVQAGQSSLTLPAGSSVYIFGFGTGGLYPSSGFSQGSYQQLVDAAGIVNAGMAITTSNVNSFGTNAAYYTIGGIGVSGFTTMGESYGANNSPGAASATDTVTITQPSLVVVAAIAGGEAYLTVSGIPGLQVDGQVGNPSGGAIALVIAHASLSPGTYTITEDSIPSPAPGQDPNHMGDLIGVFVFSGSTSTEIPPTPTVTPALSSYPPLPTLFGPTGASFLSTFENDSSPNAQEWLTSPTIAPNISSATKFLTLSPNVKQAFGDVSTGAAAVSTALGIDGTLLNPLDPSGELLTGIGLLQLEPQFNTLNPTQQLEFDGVSAAVSCITAAFAAGEEPQFDAGCALAVGSGAAGITSVIAAALQKDPSDPDYQQVFVPDPVIAVPTPLTAMPQNLSIETWSALGAEDVAGMWLNAVRITANRYATALAAGDPVSAGLQYMAFLNYLGQYVQAAGVASADLTQLANLLETQGIGTGLVTGDQISQGLTFLQTQGTSSPFIAQFFSSLGFTSAQVQTMIQEAEENPPLAPVETPIQALRILAFAFEQNSTPEVVLPTSSYTCDGIYDGTFKGDLTVSNGETCIFTGGAITGNVRQNGGSLLLLGTTVSGNLQINGGGQFYIGSSTTIRGNLQIVNLPYDSAENYVCGSNIGNNLQFTENGAPVAIGSPSLLACPGNLVRGNLQAINNSSDVLVAKNAVGDNLQVMNNSGLTLIQANTVTNNLACQNNSSITGSGNSARQKQGQCSGF